jgi:UDP-N-acetylglucosamine 2-epimerase
MKLVTIVGARPQFIKAAAVSRAIQSYNRQGSPLNLYGSREKIKEIWVHTGQHYDFLMDRVFFEELELPRPRYHLGVGSGSHGRQTGMMLERIEAVLLREKPDGTLVYGDTNSTLAGALASAKLNIPLAHVEAGLRSYNRIMPEEINRLLTDHLSTLLFCPTPQAVTNLRLEGIKGGKSRLVKNVGDVMYDSILYFSELAERRSTILNDLNLVNPNDRSNPQSAFRIPKYYLATLHRAENTDDPQKLKSILRVLNEIAKTTPVILPLHLRTKRVLQVYRLRAEGQRVRLIDPVSYLDMLRLEKNAEAILTDSGGIQKEAYWFKVPCITLREETEWVETVRQGWNRLVGSNKEKIVEALIHFNGEKPARIQPQLFGNGKAAQRIVQTLAKHFKMES